MHHNPSIETALYSFCFHCECVPPTQHPPDNKDARLIAASCHCGIVGTSPLSLQIPFIYFFLGPRRGAPMLAPRSLTLSTLSMLPRIFWSGVAVPRSKVATVADVSPIFLPSSAWVMVGSNFWRACSMAFPTSFPTVLGLTMSSERSTLVRRWPSLLPP